MGPPLVPLCAREEGRFSPPARPSVFDFLRGVETGGLPPRAVCASLVCSTRIVLAGVKASAWADGLWLWAFCSLQYTFCFELGSNRRRGLTDSGLDRFV